MQFEVYLCTLERSHCVCVCVCHTFWRRLLRKCSPHLGIAFPRDFQSLLFFTFAGMMRKCCHSYKLVFLETYQVPSCWVSSAASTPSTSLQDGELLVWPLCLTELSDSRASGPSSINLSASAALPMNPELGSQETCHLTYFMTFDKLLLSLNKQWPWVPDSVPEHLERTRPLRPAGQASLSLSEMRSRFREVS